MNYLISSTNSTLLQHTMEYNQTIFNEALEIILSNNPKFHITRMIDNYNTHIIVAQSSNEKNFIKIKVAKHPHFHFINLSGDIKVDHNYIQQMGIEIIMYNTIIQTIEDYTGTPINEISLDLLRYID